MNELAVDFLERKRAKPWSLFFAHKAVHPDAEQAADGTFASRRTGGYVVGRAPPGPLPRRVFPKKPNMLPPAEVVKQKPAWAEALRAQGVGARASDPRRAPRRRAGGDPAARAR